MKFKMPKTGFLYIIKRQNRAFDGSKYEIILENEKYDVIPSERDTPLERLSDFVLNIDSLCFDKVQPGKELHYSDEIGKQLGIEINQLLLG